MSLLAGKTVVVSGVGAGLGHQVAAAVVRDGGNAVLGARTEANLAKSAAGIDPEGTRTAFRATDITDEGQCEALAALARERFGGIDAVVQVAAWDSYFGGLEDADFTTWRSVVDVNLLGTLRMTRACLHRIRVNAVLPGWMWGPPVQAYVRFTALTEGVPEEEVLTRLSERMALPELATDGDVADAAVFLASDRARAITGQSLLVNAGELMR
ncbi:MULTISPECIES: SDR family oxidoreductase [unclassified Streptomyces]|uniref:SDR family oxidoreductase n=1 Tax=unclassified Streptomyces TaxID=2593676 RepID=UPI0004C7ED23|nr:MULTISPECIES: SDR family oxidoreductase [unclassified Streptomyces]KOV77303.1 short-chain dehydrogenase [Streptomyces sp. NRRL WC-3723]